MAWRDWIRTVEIEPSLNAADPAATPAQVEALLRTGCRIFHLTVAGERDLAVAESVAPVLRRYGGVLDVHLTGDVGVLAAIAEGANSVTVDILTPEAADAARGQGCQLGAVSPLRGDAIPVDLVLVAVDGSDESVARASAAAASLPEGACLQIVGDLNHDTVRRFYDAGATLLVVGSAIFEREDLPRAYRRLVQALA